MSWSGQYTPLILHFTTPHAHDPPILEALFRISGQTCVEPIGGDFLKQPLAQMHRTVKKSRTADPKARQALPTGS